MKRLADYRLPADVEARCPLIELAQHAVGQVHVDAVEWPDHSPATPSPLSRRQRVLSYLDVFGIAEFFLPRSLTAWICI